MACLDLVVHGGFTQAADAMAQIAIQNALFLHPFGLGYGNVDSLIMPWCTFTEREIARVGMYEKDAQEKGLEVEAYMYKLDELDRAILDREKTGLRGFTFKKGRIRFSVQRSWLPMPAT